MPVSERLRNEKHLSLASPDFLLCRKCVNVECVKTLSPSQNLSIWHFT